jgi:hypothetical protein
MLHVILIAPSANMGFDKLLEDVQVLKILLAATNYLNYVAAPQKRLPFLRPLLQPDSDYKIKRAFAIGIIH